MVLSMCQGLTCVFGRFRYQKGPFFLLDTCNLSKCFSACLSLMFVIYTPQKTQIPTVKAPLKIGLLPLKGNGKKSSKFIKFQVRKCSTNPMGICWGQWWWAWIPFTYRCFLDELELVHCVLSQRYMEVLFGRNEPRFRYTEERYVCMYIFIYIYIEYQYIYIAKSVSAVVCDT